MKKIIGVIGVAVLSMVMFFNSNSTNNLNESLTLSRLLSINSANANPEDGDGGGSPCATYCTYSALYSCSVYFPLQNKRYTCLNSVPV